MIRKIIEKNESFNEYSQKDINLMMSHINSYSRKKLNDKTPIELFNFLYGSNISNQFEIVKIKPNKVTMSKLYLKNKNSY